MLIEDCCCLLYKTFISLFLFCFFTINIHYNSNEIMSIIHLFLKLKKKDEDIRKEKFSNAIVKLRN